MNVCAHSFRCAVRARPPRPSVNAAEALCLRARIRPRRARAAFTTGCQAFGGPGLGRLDSLRADTLPSGATGGQFDGRRQSFPAEAWTHQLAAALEQTR